MIRLALQDAVIAPLWLCVNASLVTFAIQLVSFLDPIAGLAERIVLSGLVVVALIVLAATTLSAFGWLTGIALLCVVGVVSCIGLYWLNVVPCRMPYRDQLTTAPDSTKSNAHHSLCERWLWFCISTLLLSHMLVEGVFTLPVDWDSLMYHMPMIDEWIQAGTLYSAASAYWWQPGVNELIGFWIVAPFSGDFLIGLNNLPIVVIWTAATWSIARSVGLTRDWAHLTTLAVILVHTTFHETDDASNDLAVVAYWSAALACGLRYSSHYRPSDAVFCGISLGLLVGVKYFALGYASVIFVAVVGSIAMRQGWYFGLRAAKVLVLNGVFLGGFWYLRNVIVSGSPVFPLGMTGSTPSLGYSSIFLSTFLGNGDSTRFSIALDILWNFAGPYHFIAVSTAPITFLFILCAGLQNRRRPASATNTILAVALVGSFLVWIITPMLVEDSPGTLNHLLMGYTPIRFGLCFLSIAVVAMSWAIRECLTRVSSSSPFIDGKSNYIVKTVFIGLISWNAKLRVCSVWNKFNFIETLLIAFALIAVAVLLESLPRFNWAVSNRPKPARLLLAGMTISALFTVSIVLLSEHWHSSFDDHFSKHLGSETLKVIANEFPDEKRICVLDLRIYPFFGSARQRIVYRPRQIRSLKWMKKYIDVNCISLLIAHYPSGISWDMYEVISEELMAPCDDFIRVKATGSHQMFRTPAFEK